MTDDNGGIVLWPEVAKIAQPRVYPGLVEEGARNAHAIRFKGSEPIIAVSHGPLRANSGGENYPG
jgi:hypothetical protein